MTETTTAQVTTDPTAETLSPYACAKIVNAALAERGVEKVLPPQMFYTYVKKAYIETTDKKKVSMVNLQVWFEKYFAKLTNAKTEEVAEETTSPMEEEGKVFAAETAEA